MLRSDKVRVYRILPYLVALGAILFFYSIWLSGNTPFLNERFVLNANRDFKFGRQLYFGSAINPATQKEEESNNLKGIWHNDVSYMSCPSVPFRLFAQPETSYRENLGLFMLERACIENRKVKILEIGV